MQLRATGNPDAGVLLDRLVFSPDGRWFASTTGGEVRVWDVALGKEADWFKNTLGLRAVGFSSDGRTLVTDGRGGAINGQQGEANCLIQHWEVGTGKWLRKFDLEKGVGSLDLPTLSPDGRAFLLFGREECSLWDSFTGQQKAVWPDRLGRSRSVAFAPEGETFAFLDNAGTLHVYDTTTGKQIAQATGGEEGFADLALRPGRNGLVSGGETSLRCWDASVERVCAEIQACRGPCAFSPDGKWLACADGSGIHLFEAASWAEVRRFGDPGDWIRSLCFSPDARLLATSHGDRVELWDVATGKPKHPYFGHRGPVISLAFSSDGRSLASGGGANDHTLQVWDLSMRKPRIRRLTTPDGDVLSIAHSSDGKIIATGEGHFQTNGKEEMVRLWDAHTGSLLRQFAAHHNGVYTLAFSPDSKTLASGGGDDMVRLWDVRDGTKLREIPVNSRSDQIAHIAFAPSGKRLAAVSKRGELLVCDTETGEPCCHWGDAERFCFAAFGQDDKTLVAIQRLDRNPSASGHRAGDLVSVREIGSRKEPCTFEIPGASSEHFAISPDGMLLATEVNGRNIRVWDVQAGQELCQFSGHTGDISSVTFSPDGKTLASGSQDTTVLLWMLSSQVRLEALWPELGVADEAKGAGVAKSLAQTLKETVPYLQQRLEGVAAAESLVRHVASLLNDDNFDVREKASADLRTIGAGAEFELQRLVEENPPPETRRRLEESLSNLQTAPRNKDLLPPTVHDGEERNDAAAETRRILRAFALLEEADTPEARQVLQALARAEPGMWCTQQAKASLARVMGKYNENPPMPKAP